jgi:hypothetical protein
MEDCSRTKGVYMSALLSVPRVWEILKRFEEWCKRKGWKTSEEGDWVRVDHEYHDFVWIKNVHLSTFRKVTQDPKCTIRDGFSYRVVNAAYIAWLFQQPPSTSLLQTLTEDPSLSERTALYDLSQLYQGNPVCLKLNATKSEVFEEFERFLSENWGVSVEVAYKA